MASWSVRAPAY